MIYRENWEFYCECNSIKKLTGTIGEIEGELLVGAEVGGLVGSKVGFGVGDLVGCNSVKIQRI